MANTRDELERFHQFAIDQLATTDPAPELSELMLAWCDQQERHQINDVIRQGLAEIDAGRGRPATEVAEEPRARYGIPSV